MTQCYFIAGTDTGIGKTTIACQLLKSYNQQGLKTLGLKPVASGCEKTPAGLRNEDGLLLQAASSVQRDYDIINPITLEPAIAPHIAAAEQGVDLSVAKLKQNYINALDDSLDILIVEGCGGWLVPLNQHETMADFVIACDLPVILVVGMRLGCLSHALLTVKAMQQQSIQLAAWVANCLEPDMPALQQNIETLEALIPAPRLDIPFLT